jgi:hypothetical protein
MDHRACGPLHGPDFALVSWPVFKTRQNKSDSDFRKMLILTNLLTDLIIVVLPIKSVWQLQMRKTEKFAVLACFSLGGACIIISLARFSECPFQLPRKWTLTHFSYNLRDRPHWQPDWNLAHNLHALQYRAHAGGTVHQHSHASSVLHPNSCQIQVFIDEWLWSIGFPQAVRIKAAGCSHSKQSWSPHGLD